MISLSIIHNFNRSDIYPKPFFFILEFHVKPLCVSRGWLFFSFFFFSYKGPDSKYRLLDIGLCYNCLTAIIV